MRFLLVSLIATLAGCKKTTEPAAGSGSAAGSSVASPAGSAAGSAGSAAVAPAGSAAVTDGGVGDALPDGAVAIVPTGKFSSCLPDGGDRLAYKIGRIGGELVICGDGENEAVSCWTVDPATGKVNARAGTHLAGYSYDVPVAKLTQPRCYQGLCWKAPTKDKYVNSESVWVAFHPDGKRVAILDDPEVNVFDLATKKQTATFTPKLGNSAGGLWFAAELVMVRGNDAGPYSVLALNAPDGKAVGQLTGLYDGDVGITDDGRAVVAEESMSRVTVLDATTGKGKPIKRKLPKAPCDWTDPGRDFEDPAEAKCVAWIKKHISPYSAAMLINDGPNFLGFANDELFVLDGKTLAETSRVKLTMCPKPPEPAE